MHYDVEVVGGERGGGGASEEGDYHGAWENIEYTVQHALHCLPVTCITQDPALF